MNVGEGRTVCFLVEPTDRAIRSLRRFVYGSNGGACTVTRSRIHDAEVVVGEVPLPDDLLRRGLNGSGHPGRRSKGDPPWPTHCACGYAFTPADERQINIDRIYADAADPTRRWPLRDLPPGGMWDAQWSKSFGVGDDGLALVVRLPCGHDWHIDGPATNAPAEKRGWTRTGTPPKISASPSIGCGASPYHYHGWLGINGNPPGVLSAHIG